MKFCSWNIRGLKTFLLDNKVVLMGCFETKVKARGAAKIKKNFGTDWEIGTNYSTYANGRIWICWRPREVIVNILVSFAQLVHCLVMDNNSQFTCHITFIYGYNTEGKENNMESTRAA